MSVQPHTPAQEALLRLTREWVRPHYRRDIFGREVAVKGYFREVGDFGQGLLEGKGSVFDSPPDEVYFNENPIGRQALETWARKNFGWSPKRGAQFYGPPKPPPFHYRMKPEFLPRPKKLPVTRITPEVSWHDPAVAEVGGHLHGPKLAAEAVVAAWDKRFKELDRLWKVYDRFVKAKGVKSPEAKLIMARIRSVPVPAGPMTSERHVADQMGHDHWGGAGAAGLFIRAPSGKVLMQQRFGMTHQGLGLPGGALLDGEAPEWGAAREAKEEFGSFPVLRLRGVRTEDHGGWAYHTVIADAHYEFKVKGKTQEQLGATWMLPSEVKLEDLTPGLRQSWAAIVRRELRIRDLALGFAR